MDKRIVITASVLGFFGVLLGAFAAHGLQSLVTEKEIASFQTGVRYQFYHAFLLLFIGSSTYIGEFFKKRIYVLVLVGIIFFSGSIYILTLDQYIIGQNVKAIAFITPVGGLLLLAAWALLFVGLLKKNRISKK